MTTTTSSSSNYYYDHEQQQQMFENEEDIDSPNTIALTNCGLLSQTELLLANLDSSSSPKQRIKKTFQRIYAKEVIEPQLELALKKKNKKIQTSKKRKIENVIDIDLYNSSQQQQQIQSLSLPNISSSSSKKQKTLQQLSMLTYVVQKKNKYFNFSTTTSSSSSFTTTTETTSSYASASWIPTTNTTNSSSVFSTNTNYIFSEPMIITPEVDEDGIYFPPTSFSQTTMFNDDNYYQQSESQQLSELLITDVSNLPNSPPPMLHTEDENYNNEENQLALTVATNQTSIPDYSYNNIFSVDYNLSMYNNENMNNNAITTTNTLARKGRAGRPAGAKNKKTILNDIDDLVKSSNFSLDIVSAKVKKLLSTISPDIVNQILILLSKIYSSCNNNNFNFESQQQVQIENQIYCNCNCNYNNENENEIFHLKTQLKQSQERIQELEQRVEQLEEENQNLKF